MAKRGRKPDAERREKVNAMLAAGLSASEIAKEIGVSRQCIYALLNRMKKEAQSGT